MLYIFFISLCLWDMRWNEKLKKQKNLTHVLFWVIHFNATWWYAKFVFPGCLCHVRINFTINFIDIFSSRSTCVSFLSRALVGNCCNSQRFKWVWRAGCCAVVCRKWWTWWGMWRIETETFPTLGFTSCSCMSFIAAAIATSTTTTYATMNGICVVRVSWHRWFTWFGWRCTKQIVVQRQRLKTRYSFERWRGSAVWGALCGITRCNGIFWQMEWCHWWTSFFGARTKAPLNNRK